MITSEILRCPYHKDEIFMTIEDQNDHMQVSHWIGLDLFSKPIGDETVI